MLEIYLYIRLA